MFCPRCATDNIDGARFCRACGADVSLVPMAMSGRLPEAAPQPVAEVYQGRGRKFRRPPSHESAWGSLGVGIAFALISVLLVLFTRHGANWAFWLLIPAFALTFKGIGQLARIRSEGQAALPAPNIPMATVAPAMPQAPARAEFAPYNTSELMPPPPSVTEGTTRHLGQEGPTRVFEVRAERPKQEQ